MMRTKHNVGAFAAAALRLMLSCSVALYASAPWAASLDASAQGEVSAVAERYQRLLRQLDEIDNQARTLDILIDRAEALDQVRGRGAEASAQASAATTTPVVATARREEAEAQIQAMPDLPRVSPDVGGVLTPKGRWVLEPSMHYSYSSVNRVAIEGFTILPALLIGVIDVVEADRETSIAALTARYGITNRLEMEVKSSYVRRKDSTRSREFLTDAVEETTFSAQGAGVGDYELGLRYQFPRRHLTSPYIVGNLRMKSASGTDPFELATQSALTGDPQFANQLPTGSGFQSVSPSLTMIYPSDPVVFFGSLGYLWTQEDDKGTSVNGDGDVVGFGVVDPGDAWRLSLGLGLGLNDRASLSISYQLDRFTKTWIETASEQAIAGSDATVGKLLIGYSLRMRSGNPLNLAFGIGATGDAPDTDLSFQIPFSFR